MKKGIEKNIEGKSTNINMVRFFAAIGVLISHAHALSDGSVDWLGRVVGVTWGSVAVSFFFFVSGFYISKSLTIKNLSGKEYIFLRIRRIIPSLAIVVFASIFFLGSCLTTLKADIYFRNMNTWKYLLNICLIPVHELPGVFKNGNLLSTVNGSLWTLPVEFLCYLLLYLLYKIKFLEKSRRAIMNCCILIASVVLYYIGLCFSSSIILSTAQAIVLFFAGVLYYVNKDKIFLDIRLGIFAIIGWILCGRMGVSFWGNALFLPILIVTFLIGTKQILHRVSKIGNLSYAMYLTAFPVQQTVISLNGGAMSPYLNIVLSIPVVLALAYGVCWVEKRYFV